MNIYVKDTALLEKYVDSYWKKETTLESESYSHYCVLQWSCNENVAEACLDLDCHKINNHHHCSELKYLTSTATFTKLSRPELHFGQNHM
jgi:hypothetical protein